MRAWACFQLLVEYLSSLDGEEPEARRGFPKFGFCVSAEGAEHLGFLDIDAFLAII